MTDCSSIQGSMSSSSDVMSSTRSGVSGNSSRIRVIRLVRPNSRRILITPDNNISFGFAIRGGREFGTGFFVSKIDKNSEADLKGLRVGDQIIRVNGYQVEDAVHKELTQFISSQDRVTLKVRGVGMLPMKEKHLDPLTWHIVPRHALTTLTALDDLNTSSKDIRVMLKVAPRTKLGLGICKGPEWKPGIFVQFTKDYSVARDTGLMPGDQILSCNSIDFSDVLFSEAVAVMKSSSTLEMVVRTGAGLDLFPGESSGYNSSASSVTGDQSPCWADQSAKRLSSVREEPTAKTWNKFDRRKGDCGLPSSTDSTPPPAVITNDESNKTIIQLSENGTLINNTIISNTHHSSSGNNNNNIFRQNNGHNSHDSNLKLNYVTLPDNQKQIYRASNGPPPPPPIGKIYGSSQTTPTNSTDQYANKTTTSTGNNSVNGQKANGKIADICFVSRQSETKTVIVEVHRSASAAEEEKQRNNKSLAPAPPKPPLCPAISSSPSEMSTTSSTADNASGHNRTSSIVSSVSSTSVGGTSLSSAISEELKKRKLRRNFGNSNEMPEEIRNLELQQSRQQPTNQSQNQQQQPQQQLKRFGNPSVGGGNDAGVRHNALMDEFKRAHRRMFKNGFVETDKQERQEELKKTVIMKDEVDHRSPSSQNDFKTETNNNQSTLLGYFPTPPPPPPQFANKSVYSTNSLQRTPSQNYKPPNSPVPDYDSVPPSQTLPRNINGPNTTPYRNGSTPSRGTIGRVVKTETAKANGEIVEMESIDSYQLKNPSSNTVPRPPTQYFTPQNNVLNTMKKTQRPVSVTIGEYASTQIMRKEPSKFDFIPKQIETISNGNGHPNGNGYAAENVGSPKDDCVSDMLRSELELTLSRSNLKKRNENGQTLKYQNGGGGGELKQQGQGFLKQNGKGIDQQSSNGGGLKQNGGVKQNGIYVNSNQNIGGKSANIEKLTQMLQSKQNLLEMNNNNRSATISSSNRVTICVPTKQELRKTESSPQTPTNGILKNGYGKSHIPEKSISFGN